MFCVHLHFFFFFLLWQCWTFLCRGALRLPSECERKQMAITYQLARVAALPRGNGQLQQVDVQHTHIVCVMQMWFVRTEPLSRADYCLHLFCETASTKLRINSDSYVGNTLKRYFHTKMCF